MIKVNPGEYLPLERIEGASGCFNCVCDLLFLPEKLKQIWHVKILSGGKENEKRKSTDCGRFKLLG